MMACCSDIHHAKNATSIAIMLHTPVHCFHGSPPESTHDAQRYVRHCLCSNNSCNKCPLRRNSHSQSGLLLFKAFFHKSQTLNECWYRFKTKRQPKKKNSPGEFFFPLHVSYPSNFILKQFYSKYLWAGCTYLELTFICK